MKKIIIALLALSILFVGPASADLFDDINENVGTYNENVDQVPSLIKFMITNENILGVINMNDGTTLEMKAVTDGDGRIIKFERLEDSDFEPTITITSDEVTVQGTLDSSNPGAVFQTAYSNGDITIEARPLLTRIAMGIANIIF